MSSVATMMHAEDEEPERERDEREQQHQLLHLLQPKLLKLSSSNRDGRGSVCICGKSKGGAKSVEAAAKDVTSTGATVDAASLATKQ